MKICRDCTHCNLAVAPSHCEHPLALTSTDHVTGIRSYKTCWYMRAQSGDCGADATLHTPHGPIMRFVISLLGISS